MTDLAGVTRAKYVPLRRLGDFQRSGMGVSPSWSVFCVDTGIAFTPTIGVAGDLRIRIDPADVRLIDDGVAWAPGNLDDQHGNPAPLCVRSILASAEQAAAERGLNVLLGAELECTMLALDGGPASTAPWSPYGIRTSLEHAAFLSDLAVAAERSGLSIEQLHTEYGHDQGCSITYSAESHDGVMASASVRRPSTPSGVAAVVCSARLVSSPAPARSQNSASLNRRRASESAATRAAQSSPARCHSS